MKKQTKRKPSKRKLRRSSQKTIAFIILGVTAFLLIINVGTFLYFKNKTYPKTSLNNVPISSIPTSKLEQKAQSIISTPENIKLTAGEKSKQASPEELGISVDYPKISNQIKQNRHVIPFLNLFITSKNNAVFSIDKPKTEAYLNSVKPDLEVLGSAAKIDRQADKFIEIVAVKPLTIDLPTAVQNIESSMQAGQAEVNLPTQQGDAPANPIDIQAELTKLNKSTQTSVKLTFNDKLKSLSPSEIANLFEPDNSTFKLSQKNIGYLLDATAKSFGISLGNKAQATNQISTAIQNNTNSTVVLEPAPEKRISYTYCVSAKGVDESHLGAFRSKLASVYADSRGWGMGGRITFNPVASGCSFTAWLTAAELVPSFSSTICDSTWSCRVGNNVIINFDRWVSASPAWNGAGGALDEYRSMVINHETGHWLGFSHRFCGGAGQSAPVMQQQSISLQGCNFNAWPSPAELQSLKSSKGL